MDEMNNQVPGSESNTQTNGSNETAGGQTGKQPFAVFPDEHSFMSRVQREAKKEFKNFLKTHGFDDEEAFTTSLTNSKTELTNLQEQLNANSKLEEQFNSRYNDMVKTYEAKEVARELGVKPERINHLMKLADISGVQVVDGQVDAEALKSAFESVLSDFPEFKGVSVPAKSGGDFSTAKTESFLSMDMIKNMTPAEYKARQAEIHAFLSKQGKK